MYAHSPHSTGFLAHTVFYPLTPPTHMVFIGLTKSLFLLLYLYLFSKSLLYISISIAIFKNKQRLHHMSYVPSDGPTSLPPWTPSPHPPHIFHPIRFSSLFPNGFSGPTNLYLYFYIAVSSLSISTSLIYISISIFKKNLRFCHTPCISSDTPTPLPRCRLSPPLNGFRPHPVFYFFSHDCHRTG